MTDEEVQRWDEWFALTECQTSIRAWNAVKNMTYKKTWTSWAYMIESNRLAALERNDLEVAHR